MRTLSIRQPWCWLITRPDITDEAARAQALARSQIKPVESRDWTTSYRGEFLIHAGSGIVQRDYRETAAWVLDNLDIELPPFNDPAVPRGGIVGMAELVDIVTDHDSPFYVPGSYGWVLANARALPFVPWKGQLGWFDVPRSAAGLPAPEAA